MPFIKLADQYVKSYTVTEDLKGYPYVTNIIYTPKLEEAENIPHGLLTRVLAVVRKETTQWDPSGNRTLVSLSLLDSTPKELVVKPRTRTNYGPTISVDNVGLKLYFAKQGLTIVAVGRLLGLSGSRLKNFGRVFIKDRPFPRTYYHALRKIYPSISYYVRTRGA